MIYDRTTIAPCVIQAPTAPDSRCQDSTFSLQHPDICAAGSLIIKPGVLTLCVLDSVIFSVFELVNGAETELTDGLSFTSSDPSVFAIGVNSGSGTAMAAGIAIITATYGTRTVSATLTIQEEATCCDDVIVATAIVVDNSYSMSLGNFAGYGSRLNYAKAVASSYGGTIAEANGSPKDTVGVLTISNVLTELLAQSQDTVEILAAIAAIAQTNLKTDLLTVFTVAAQNLLALGVDKPVLLLISDCEQSDMSVSTSTSTSTTAAVVPITPATPACKNISGFGSPLGVRTPDCIDQFYRDKSNNSLWQSTGLTNQSWLPWII